MPGFTSFLLGHSPFSAAIQGSSSSPPPPDSDSEIDHSDSDLETDASKKRRLQIGRKRARQTSLIYGTTMTRRDAAQTLELLKHLKSAIEHQIETFHDMGVASGKGRTQGISEFLKRNQIILGDGARVLERFEGAQGAARDLSRGILEVKRSVGSWEGEMRGVDVGDVESVVVVYQRWVEKPLGHVVKGVGKALGREECWSDPE